MKIMIVLSVSCILLLVAIKTGHGNECNHSTEEQPQVERPTRDAEEKKERGACECAVFNGPNPRLDAEPLISRTLWQTECDESGGVQCKDLCVALATAARDRSNDVLCGAVGHAVKLRASVFSRVCDGDYTSTGLLAEKPVCCHESMPVDCEHSDAA